MSKLNLRNSIHPTSTLQYPKVKSAPSMVFNQLLEHKETLYDNDGDPRRNPRRTAQQATQRYLALVVESTKEAQGHVEEVENTKEAQGHVEDLVESSMQLFTLVRVSSLWVIFCSHVIPQLVNVG